MLPSGALCAAFLACVSWRTVHVAWRSLTLTLSVFDSLVCVGSLFKCVSRVSNAPAYHDSHGSLVALVESLASSPGGGCASCVWMGLDYIVRVVTRRPW